MNPKPNSIQEYFSWFPPEIQAKLQQMREILRQAVPEAEEVISYHMPAFKTSEKELFKFLMERIYRYNLSMI
ncbi:MAG: DUF1801 domain-containing protein [Algoriphagus sp.]|nr:DUF1801 domain-containing protein [Algoriphagus sp.]